MPRPRSLLACLSACLQAHEAVKRIEAEPQRAEGEDEDWEGPAASAARHRERAAAFLEAQQRERWDCESVLRWVGNQSGRWAGSLTPTPNSYTLARRSAVSLATQHSTSNLIVCALPFPMCSLRSNLDNHPGRISEPRGAGKGRGRGGAGAADAAAGGERAQIRLDKDGIPMGVLPPPRRGAGAAAAPLQQQQEKQGEDGSSGSGSDEEGASDGSEGGHVRGSARGRDKGESAEEKRARKAAVKEAKRSARCAKKELKGLFKDASQQAQRRAATAQPQAALKLPS